MIVSCSPKYSCVSFKQLVIALNISLKMLFGLIIFCFKKKTTFSVPTTTGTVNVGQYLALAKLAFVM